MEGVPGSVRVRYIEGERASAGNGSHGSDSDDGASDDSAIGEVIADKDM